MDDAVTDVTVAMVTWNSEAHLPEAFASLPAGFAGVDSWQLFIADNDSADDSVARARALRPDVTVIQMGRNAGYAAGLNAIVRDAPGSGAYLFLNPDVRLEPQSVARLLDCVRTSGAGIAVPRLVDPQGTVHRSLRREPTVGRALGEAVLGGTRAGRYGRLGEIVMSPESYEHPGVADWATGAAMLVTRACLDAVGPWDESFFLYSEETDFALRARDAGYSLRYCPEAVAMHVGGDAHISAELYTLLVVNRLKLFRRRNGRTRGMLFWLAATLNEGLRARRPVHQAALRTLLSPRAFRATAERGG
jgi:N-acetylglucosaminyl-diphospho-decaprenol L-rhamnosyltransferase